VKLYDIYLPEGADKDFDLFNGCYIVMEFEDVDLQTILDNPDLPLS
jgi:hypothetical protein